MWKRRNTAVGLGVLTPRSNGGTFFYKNGRYVYLNDSPPRQFPHHTGIGPDEWLYWLVMVLVGSSPRDNGPGGQYLGFIFIPWGIFPCGELSLEPKVCMIRAAFKRLNEP